MPRAPQIHGHRDGVFNDRLPDLAFLLRGQWQVGLQCVGHQSVGHGRAYRRATEVAGNKRGQLRIRQRPVAEFLLKLLQFPPVNTCQGQFNDTVFGPRFSGGTFAKGSDRVVSRVTD